MGRGKQPTSPFSSAAGLYAGFKRDGGVRLAAAVAYYSLFALAPLLVLTVSGAQWLLGSDQVALGLQQRIETRVGAEYAAVLTDVLRSSLTSKYDTTVGAVGVLLLLWAVVVAYSHLHESFNTLWHVRVRSDVSLADRLRTQLPRLALVLLPASLLIGATLASSALSWVAANTSLAAAGTVVSILGSPIMSAGAAWIALVILYRFVPDARVRFKAVAMPASVVAIAWALGTWAYGQYLATVGTESASGAAGAVFLLLIWMNYTARAVLLGCSWCRWSTENDGEVEPLRHAERINA